MNIDWFTLAAQIINFLILVALLRWFLYGPIVRAMKQREAGIASRLEEADRRCREADEKAQQFEDKNQELDANRRQILDEVQREVQQKREQLTKDAHEQVQSKRAEWLAAFEHERDELLSETRRQAGRLATEATQRTLEQLAGASLEEQMCATFLSRLRDMDDAKRAEMSTQWSDGDGRVLVRSAFAVPDTWRDQLRETIRDIFAHDAKVSFETSAELVCGFELEAGGYSFGWNISEFLRTLEHDFNVRLTRLPASTKQ